VDFLAYVFGCCVFTGDEFDQPPHTIASSVLKWNSTVLDPKVQQHSEWQPKVYNIPYGVVEHVIEDKTIDIAFYGDLYGAKLLVAMTTPLFASNHDHGVNQSVYAPDDDQIIYRRMSSWLNPNTSVWRNLKALLPGSVGIRVSCKQPILLILFLFFLSAYQCLYCMILVDGR
jgi:hypothetical protein